MTYKKGDKQCSGSNLETWNGSKWETKYCEFGCENNNCKIVPILRLQKDGDFCKNDSQCESGNCVSGTCIYRNPIEGFFASYGRDVQESVQNYSGEDIVQDLTMFGPPLIAGLLTMNPQASFATQQMMTKLPSWTQTFASVATLAQGPLAIITCQIYGADSSTCQMGAAGLSTGWFTDPIGTFQGLQGSAQQVQQVARQGLTELSFASSILNLPNAGEDWGWTLGNASSYGAQTDLFAGSSVFANQPPVVVRNAFLNQHLLPLSVDDIGASATMYQTNPNTVIKLFNDPNDFYYFETEYANAQILGNLGVGPKVISPIRTPSGQFGYEMEFLSGNFPQNVPQYITADTIPSLQKSAEIVRQAGYEIGDFQYFVQPDGSIKIIDAGSMRPLGFFEFDVWTSNLDWEMKVLTGLQLFK